jgi:hypothetical protein
MGRKADDLTAIPLDRACHEKRQSGHIYRWSYGQWLFVGGGSPEMKAWCCLAIYVTQTRLGYADPVAEQGG